MSLYSFVKLVPLGFYLTFTFPPILRLHLPPPRNDPLQTSFKGISILASAAVLQLEIWKNAKF